MGRSINGLLRFFSVRHRDQSAHTPNAPQPAASPAQAQTTDAVQPGASRSRSVSAPNQPALSALTPTARLSSTELNTRRTALQACVERLESELAEMRAALAAKARSDAANDNAAPPVAPVLQAANAAMGIPAFTACGSAGLEMELDVATLSARTRTGWGLPPTGQLVVTFHMDTAEPFPQSPPSVSIEWRGGPMLLAVTSAVPTAQPQFRVGYQLMHIVCGYLKQSWTSIASPDALAGMHAHLSERLRSLGEHCVVCDTKQAMPAHKPTTCVADACRTQFIDLGLGFDPSDVRRAPKAADLMITLAQAACGSGQVAFIDHLPTSYKGDPSLRALSTGLSNLPPVSTLLKAPHMLDELERAGKGSVALLQWALSHNRGRMRELNRNERFSGLPTQYQFKLYASPDAEAAFANERAAHGGEVKYAFHGSPLRNWHSILRNGLRVGHSGQAWGYHGAASGQGIYLAHEGSMSAGYSTTGTGTWQRSIFGADLRCIALCEVIPKAKYTRSFGFVVTQEAHVLPRYLFVFTGSFAVSASTLEAELRARDR